MIKELSEREIMKRMKKKVIDSLNLNLSKFTILVDSNREEVIDRYYLAKIISKEIDIISYHIHELNNNTLLMLKF